MKGQTFLATEDFIKAAGPEYVEVVVEAAEASDAASEGDSETPVNRMNKDQLIAKALELGIEEDVVEAGNKKELRALVEEALEAAEASADDDGEGEDDADTAE